MKHGAPPEGRLDKPGGLGGGLERTVGLCGEDVEAIFQKFWRKVLASGDCLCESRGAGRGGFSPRVMRIVIIGSC